MKFTLIFLLLFSGFGYSQSKKIQVTLRIDSAFIEDFKNQEIHLYAFSKQFSRSVILKNNYTCLFDTLPSERFTLAFSADIEYDHLNLTKHFMQCVTVNTTQVDSTLCIVVAMPQDCENDKDFKNKVCPICRKSDQRIPIKYGMEPIEWERDPSDKYKKKEYESYGGGCMIYGCDPNWYCKRDKKEF